MKPIALHVSTHLQMQEVYLHVFPGRVVIASLKKKYRTFVYLKNMFEYEDFYISQCFVNVLKSCLLKGNRIRSKQSVLVAFCCYLSGSLKSGLFAGLLNNS